MEQKFGAWVNKVEQIRGDIFVTANGAVSGTTVVFIARGMGQINIEDEVTVTVDVKGK